jgi:hypothetical protein
MIDLEYVRHVCKAKEVTFVSNGEELQDEINHESWIKGPIIFRPDARRVNEDFEELSNVLFDPPEKYSSAGFAIVVDEGAQLQSANRIDPNLDRAVRQHPRSVLVIQTTHSLQDWSRPSKDLMSYLYCFRQVGRSLKAVVDYCDGDEDLEETIRSLPHHWCIRYSFEAIQGEETWVLINKPESWYKERKSEEVYGD